MLILERRVNDPVKNTIYIYDKLTGAKLTIELRSVSKGRAFIGIDGGQRFQILRAELEEQCLKLRT